MAMSGAQFAEFWAALGKAVRIAVQPDAGKPGAGKPETATPPAVSEDKTPQRDASSTTTATSERAWTPVHRTPAAARAFGFGTVTE
jgi:hypothetical protein